MPKEQKTSTKEFKIEAVRLAETSGKPITDFTFTSLTWKLFE